VTPSTAPAAERTVSFSVNGRAVTLRLPVRKTLADVLREDLHLTGTHLGCEHGVCGACTILMDEEPVRSCLLLGVQADRHALRTVEGLANGETLHPLQAAFRDAHGLQCGYCTPGFLMTAVAFLRENPNPTEEEIRIGIAGNLCRCTGYIGIIEAIQLAARRMRGDDPGAPDAASPDGAPVG